MRRRRQQKIGPFSMPQPRFYRGVGDQSLGEMQADAKGDGQRDVAGYEKAQPARPAKLRYLDGQFHAVRRFIISKHDKASSRQMRCGGNRIGQPSRIAQQG
jgi:hypothetical protein